MPSASGASSGGTSGGCDGSTGSAKALAARSRSSIRATIRARHTQQSLVKRVLTVSRLMSKRHASWRALSGQASGRPEGTGELARGVPTQEGVSARGDSSPHEAGELEPGGAVRIRTEDGGVSDGEWRPEPAGVTSPRPLGSELADHFEERRPLPYREDPQASSETPGAEFSVDDAHVLHHVSSGDHAAHRADQP